MASPHEPWTAYNPRNPEGRPPLSLLSGHDSVARNTRTCPARKFTGMGRSRTLGTPFAFVTLPVSRPLFTGARPSPLRV